MLPPKDQGTGSNAIVELFIPSLTYKHPGMAMVQRHQYHPQRCIPTHTSFLCARTFAKLLVTRTSSP